MLGSISSKSRTRACRRSRRRCDPLLRTGYSSVILCIHGSRKKQPALSYAHSRCGAHRLSHSRTRSHGPNNPSHFRCLHAIHYGAAPPRCRQKRCAFFAQARASTSRCSQRSYPSGADCRRPIPVRVRSRSGRRWYSRRRRNLLRPCLRWGPERRRWVKKWTTIRYPTHRFAARPSHGRYHFDYRSR